MTEPLNEAATLRDLLFGDAAGNASDALAESLREHGTLAPLVSGVPPLTAVVNRKVADATDGLLSLNLADVAANGWRKFDALRQAARRTCEPAGTDEEIVTLASHRIECSQHPTIELFVDGKSIATIQIDLQIAMDIAGGLAVVQRGRLTEIRTARCTVSGSLAIQQTVIKRKQRQFDLPGAVRLRNGVALLTPETGITGVDQIVVDQAKSPSSGAWYSDPTHRYELRWWDGSRWTQSVANHGNAMSDPVAC
jgi:hypothetical protein